MPFPLRLIIAAAQAFQLLIFVRCLLSWFARGGRNNVFVEFIYTVTEPVMRPFRRIVPPLGGFDFSPLLLIFVMELIVRLMVRLASQL